MINQVREKNYDGKPVIEFPGPIMVDLDLMFDVNFRKLNITLIMTSPPVFLVSVTYLLRDVIVFL